MLNKSTPDVATDLGDDDLDLGLYLPLQVLLDQCRSAKSISKYVSLGLVLASVY